MLTTNLGERTFKLMPESRFFEVPIDCPGLPCMRDACLCFLPISPLYSAARLPLGADASESPLPNCLVKALPALFLAALRLSFSRREGRVSSNSGSSGSSSQLVRRTAPDEEPRETVSRFDEDCREGVLAKPWRPRDACARGAEGALVLRVEERESFFRKAPALDDALDRDGAFAFFSVGFAVCLTADGAAALEGFEAFACAWTRGFAAVREPAFEDLGADADDDFAFEEADVFAEGRFGAATDGRVLPATVLASLNETIFA